MENNLKKVALIGQPNVGKSSLFNRLANKRIAIVSDIAGTTRDSIDVQVKRDGKEYIFVDTAGLRRKSKIEDDTVERYSNLRTLKALAQSDVVVVVLERGKNGLGFGFLADSGSES